MGEIADAAYIAYQQALKTAQAAGTASNMQRLAEAAQLSTEMNALEQASWARTPAPAPSSPSPSAPPSPPSYTYAPPPPPPAPLLPDYRPMENASRNILVAPSDIIKFDDASVDVAALTDMLFEDIGATELANMSRSDLIDGQPTIYAPIKNLSSVRREFNPNNIIATAYGTDYFARFGIDLFARGFYEPYFDENGDLVIEVDDARDGEEIQVQVLTTGIIDIIEET